MTLPPGVTVTIVAKRLNVTYATAWRWFNGLSKPLPVNLKRLKRIFGIS
jgi:hypothetical protein